MNVIYTGKPQQFTELQTKKLSARLAKVGKMVDGRGEKELHVVFTQQRHLTKAEVTLNFHGHSAAGTASEADSFQAALDAIEKLEKQVGKLRSKWRDTSRKNGIRLAVTPEEAAEAPPLRLRRVTIGSRRKPMTVEEALLAMGKNDIYLAYRDADTGAVHVLVRVGDGKFDLIEP
jgi:putative sigma-54 modulation protein